MKENYRKRVKYRLEYQEPRSTISTAISLFSLTLLLFFYCSISVLSAFLLWAVKKGSLFEMKSKIKIILCFCVVLQWINTIFRRQVRYLKRISIRNVVIEGRSTVAYGEIHCIQLWIDFFFWKIVQNSLICIPHHLFGKPPNLWCTSSSQSACWNRVLSTQHCFKISKIHHFTSELCYHI